MEIKFFKIKIKIKINLKSHHPSSKINKKIYLKFYSIIMKDLNNKIKFFRI
jgi:hypothetical protein